MQAAIVSLQKRLWQGVKTHGIPTLALKPPAWFQPHELMQYGLGKCLLHCIGWAWVVVGTLWCISIVKEAFWDGPETARIQSLQPLPSEVQLSSDAANTLLPHAEREAIEQHSEVLTLQQGINTSTTLQQHTMKKHPHKKSSKHRASQPTYHAKVRPALQSISINQASPEVLQRLPGVGEKMAQKIVQYRKSHGGFKSIEELNEVKGVGDKTLAKWRPYLKL
ncbi:MAG: ComEA family DNA-binding protein [Vampirovibrionales bacterium]